MITRNIMKLNYTSSTGVTLELYGGEGSFARFYSGRRFDQAMTGFLTCVRQLAQWLHQRDNSVRLPFRIEDGGKIGGFQITLQFNETERWTKALKFMLIDLKWIIAFLESREQTYEASSASGGGS